MSGTELSYHRRESDVRNLAQTVQKVIQDLVAPHVQELKALVTGLQTQLNHLESGLQKQLTHVESGLQKQMDQRFESQSEKSDAHFKALMAACGEFKAQGELTSIRVIAALSERMAVLEAQRH